MVEMPPPARRIARSAGMWPSTLALSKVLSIRPRALTAVTGCVCQIGVRIALMSAVVMASTGLPLIGPQNRPMIPSRMARRFVPFHADAIVAICAMAAASKVGSSDAGSTAAAVWRSTRTSRFSSLTSLRASMCLSRVPSG